MKVEGKFECLRGVVLNYVEDKNKYRIKVSINGTYRAFMVPRVYICSDL